jgi:two-component system nitrogen regulation response regulator GlnG
MARNLQLAVQTSLERSMPNSTRLDIPGTAPTIEEERPRLLIVDDETLVSWSLANALTKAGYQVAIVDSGEKAIEELRSRAFDLLVTDIELPALSGFELASTVRERFPRVPIILMSATTECPTLPKPSNLDYFVEKPFQIKELVALIDRLLLRSPKSTPSA